MHPLRRNLPVLIAIFIAIIFFGAFFTQFASAQEGITFPIAELGNCEDKEACKEYCNDPANIEACVAFGERQGLMSKEEADHARTFAAIGKAGPGGCASIEECQTFCDNISNMDECIAFGEQHGLIPPDELEEAKKIASALRGGASLPGGCSSPRECEAFCSDMNNMRQCLAFAKSAGLIPPEELAEAEKIESYLSSGGTMPGGCTSERSCKAYCEDESHIDECIAFASGAGLMSSQEAELFRKTGGRGPGGCRGRECETFCTNPENRRACMQFSVEHNLLSEEERRQMEEGVRSSQEMLRQSPPGLIACIEAKLGGDVVAEIRAGTYLLGPEHGEVMRACSDEFFSARDAREGRGNEGPLPPDVAECARQVLGDNFNEIEKSDSYRGSAEESRVIACIQELHQRLPEPSQLHEGPPEGFQEFERGEFPGGDFERFREFEGQERFKSFEQSPREFESFRNGAETGYAQSQYYAEGSYDDGAVRTEEPQYAQSEYYAEGSYDSASGGGGFQYAQAEYYAEGNYSSGTTDEPQYAQSEYYSQGGYEAAPSGDTESTRFESSLGAQVITAIERLFRLR